MADDHAFAATISDDPADPAPSDQYPAIGYPILPSQRGESGAGDRPSEVRTVADLYRLAVTLRARGDSADPESVAARVMAAGERLAWARLQSVVRSHRGNLVRFGPDVFARWREDAGRARGSVEWFVGCVDAASIPAEMPAMPAGRPGEDD